MDLDDIFMRSYLNEFSEKEKKKILLSREDREIAEQKRKLLQPIEIFLQKFVDLEISVNHCHYYTKNTTSMHGVEPQLFAYTLVDSSKKWAPGISIWFNHPAEVEVAIPNHPDEDGVVVIKVATAHPDSYILEQRFSSFESACEALGKFLSTCTTSMGKDPTQYLEEHNKNKHQKPSNTSFVHNVPNSVPEYQHDEYSVIEEKEEKPQTILSLKKISDLFSKKSKEQKDENL